MTMEDYDELEAKADEDYEAWAAKYKPIRNPVFANNEHAAWEGRIFDTYGDEVKFVKKQESTHIWTVVEVNGSSYLLPGFHIVDRLFYFITELPWDDLNFQICIMRDIPQENNND